MAQGGVQFAGTGVEFYDPAMSFIEGSVNQYFDKKSEKRAFQRQLQLMAAQYNYAQRYAENSPSWNIKGLRDAGLNPILAVSNGANLGSTIPSAPTTTSHKPTPSSSRGGYTYDPLTRSQLNVNEATIQNLQAQASAVSKQADASWLKAETESAKTAAQTASILQQVERDKNNGGYSNEIVADVHRILNPFWEDGKKLFKSIYEDINRPVRTLHDFSTERFIKNRPMTIDEFERLKKTNPDFFNRNDFIRHSKPPKIDIRDGKKYYWHKISK